MKKTKIIENIWIDDNFQNPWIGMDWREGNHDTDRDGVPNFMDIDPLDSKPGTFGMSIQRKRR